MLLYLFLVCSVLSSIDYTSKEIADIKKTKLLTILATSQSSDYQVQQKCCFSIEVQDKNKPKGYRLMKKKFQAISNYLTNKVLIPKSKLFKPTSSEVRMNHNRRVWTFKQIVCFLTQNNKQQIETVLQKHGGMKHLNFKRIENLNQYDLITKAFHNAKQAANQFLSEIEYRIKRVHSYEITNDINFEPDSHESRNKASQYSSQSNQKQDDQSQSDDDIQTQHVQIEVTFMIQSLDQAVTESNDSKENNDYEEESDQL